MAKTRFSMQDSYRTEGRRRSPDMDVIPLWSGNTTSEDHALQLLLVVDFILDWARAIFRPKALQRIKALSVSDSTFHMTQSTDSNMFSYRPSESVDSRLKSEDIFKPTESRNPKAKKSISSKLREFESKHGCFRHAPRLSHAFAVFISLETMHRPCCVLSTTRERPVNSRQESQIPWLSVP